MARLICDKCNYEIMDGSRFCPNCADPVDEADVVATPATGKERPVAIVEFGYSSSAQYERAVEYASKFPSYECEGEGKSARHAVTIGLTDVEVVQNLWEIVGNWKTSALTIDNKRAGKKDLVYGPLGCYQKRQRATDGDHYCCGDGWQKNLWRCFQLGCGMEEVFAWWGGKYCDLRERYLVLFPDRIREDVLRKVPQFQLCPVFDARRVEVGLAKVPEQIDLLDDNRPFAEETRTARERIENDVVYQEKAEEHRRRKEELAGRKPAEGEIRITVTREKTRGVGHWVILAIGVVIVLVLAVLGIH